MQQHDDIGAWWWCSVKETAASFLLVFFLLLLHRPSSNPSLLLPAEEAWNRMQEGGIHHLVVIEQGKAIKELRNTLGQKMLHGEH